MPMYRRLVALLVLACPLSRPCPAADDPNTDQLEQRLISRDWRERRQAIAELVARGPQAEPMVRDRLRRGDDVELVKNLNVVLDRIAENRAVGPSPISLHAKDQSPREVLDEIARQGFAPVPLVPANLFDQGDWPGLTLDADRRPFWEVIRQVAGKLDLDYLSTDTQTVRLARSAGRKSLPVSTHGAFLVAMDLLSSYTRLNIDLTVYG